MTNRLSRKIAIVCALIMAFTIALPGTAFAYDNTMSAQELSQNEDGAAGDEGDVNDSSEGTSENATEDSSSENPSDSSSSEGGTSATTTAPATKATTKAKTTAAYKGKNATRIPIITYHRITSAKEKKNPNQRHSSLFLTESVFKKQMRWLHNHGYRTISTEEFYLWYTGKIKLPKKSVLITFDDGSYSVIKYALPVLKKYNMKGTIFMIGNKTRKKTRKKINKNGSYSCIGRDVMKQVQATYPNLEFQSHTYSMHRKIGGTPALRKLSYSKQKADFTKIYNKYGYRFLAYPYGKYNDNTIKAAKASHVKMAFTYGTNTYATRKQGRYKIKRIKISAGQPMSKFTRWFTK